MKQDLDQSHHVGHLRGVDVDAARRWARTLRRIDCVEFTRNGAVIHGVAHRLPLTRRVPLDAARGLVALGYPATGRQAG